MGSDRQVRRHPSVTGPMMLRLAVGLFRLLVMMTLLPPAALSIASVAAAQGADDTYKNKTINLIVAAGEGGGFDIAARLVAQHLVSFLPGRPAIVVQHEAHCSVARAAETFEDLVRLDGL